MRLTARLLRVGLERGFPGRLLVVECPGDIPPGREGRGAMRDLVTRKADQAGFEVGFGRGE
jgi:hypothetical protein